MTAIPRPPTRTTAVVLGLAEAPATWRYGYELCGLLDLKAGSMYPILVRLAGPGLAFATELAEQAARQAAGPATARVRWANA